MNISWKMENSRTNLYQRIHINNRLQQFPDIRIATYVFNTIFTLLMFYFQDNAKI